MWSAHLRIDGLQLVRLEVLVRVGLHLQHDRRAGLRALRRRHRVVAAPLGRPHPRLLRAGRAGGDLHPVRHHEGGVEAHAELPDQARPLLGLGALQRLAEGARAGAGDGAQVLRQRGAVHADARVGDGQRARLLVRHDADRGIRRQRQIGLGEGGEAPAVDRVGGVGHQLAQEDLPVGIQRVHHEIEQPAHLGAELVPFDRLAHSAVSDSRVWHSRTIAAGGDMPGAPAEFNTPGLAMS